MAAEDKKRGLHGLQANKQPRKRARTSGADVGRHASIGELAWQEVSMPDRLDDVEGFMGMEEVEGVDIFRTHDGVLRYKVCIWNC